MRCKWKLLAVISGEICKSKGSDSLPVPFSLPLPTFLLLTWHLQLHCTTRRTWGRSHS